MSNTEQLNKGVVVVRPQEELMSRQHLPYFIGISGATAGATGLSMNMIVIPPGGAAEPHTHHNYETAIYVLKGRANCFYGPGLKESILTEEGSFVFIAANVPHQPVNLSSTEPVYAIVARNDPNEQEHVIRYDPSSDA